MKQVLALAAEGARAVHVPTFPAEVGLPEYHDARYDPVWAAIQETGMSISQHLGLVESLWDLFRRDPTPQKGIFTSQPVFRLAETIGFWILPGVLARFPELKVVLVEPSLGWVPFYLDQLDKMASGPYDFPALDDKPSSYFHRQMYLTFVSDRAVLSIGTNSVSTASCGPRTFLIRPPRGRIRRASSRAILKAFQRQSGTSWSPAMPPGSTACSPSRSRREPLAALP